MTDVPRVIVVFFGLALLAGGVGCGTEDDGGHDHDHDAHSHSHGDAHGMDAGDGGASFDDYTAERKTATADGDFYVRYEPSPDPIPTEQLFEMDVWVYESSDMETTVEGSSVEVTAEMPTHGHGMNTEPEISNEETGKFNIEGMKFHMPSDEQNPWVIRLEAGTAETTDVAKFKVITGDAK